MRRLAWEDITALAPQMSGEQRRVASIAGAAHALHDGYTDLIYIMLPIWQTEFALSYAALGALRSVFVGAMACLQIPASFAADRFGAGAVLAFGTALAGLGYCFAGLSTGFFMLLGALFVSGLGASAVMSSQVSRRISIPNDYLFQLTAAAGVVNRAAGLD